VNTEGICGGGIASRTPGFQEEHVWSNFVGRKTVIHMERNRLGEDTEQAEFLPPVLLREEKKGENSAPLPAATEEKVLRILLN